MERRKRNLLMRGWSTTHRWVVFPMDTSSPPSRRKGWSEDHFADYHRACDIKQFGQPVTLPSPCFHNRDQYDLFWGTFAQAKCVETRSGCVRAS